MIYFQKGRHRFGYPSNALFSGYGRREKYHPRRRASAYGTAFALQTADGAGTGTGKATADPWEKTDHPHGRRSSPSETCGRNHRIAGKDRTGTPLGFPGALRQSLPRRRNSRLRAAAARFRPRFPPPMRWSGKSTPCSVQPRRHLCRC